MEVAVARTPTSCALVAPPFFRARDRCAVCASHVVLQCCCGAAKSYREQRSGFYISFEEENWGGLGSVMPSSMSFRANSSGERVGRGRGWRDAEVVVSTSILAEAEAEEACFSSICDATRAGAAAADAALALGAAANDAGSRLV